MSIRTCQELLLIAKQHGLAGRRAEAETVFRRILKEDPSNSEGWLGLGNLQFDNGNLDEAEVLIRCAIENDPGAAEAYNSLGRILLAKGFSDMATESFRNAMTLEPRNPYHHSCTIFCMHYDPDCDPYALLSECRQWDYLYGGRAPYPIHCNLRERDRRLRIGYVSADFRSHVLGNNILPLLSGHDHERFEIFLYCTTPGGIT